MRDRAVSGELVRCPQENAPQNVRTENQQDTGRLRNIVTSMNSEGTTEERKGFSSFSQEPRTQLLRPQPLLVPTLYRK